jgi:putative spermidine/putrescine transport system ATP-binding protein
MYLTLDHLAKIFPTRGKAAEVTAVDDVSLGIEKEICHASWAIGLRQDGHPTSHRRFGFYNRPHHLDGRRLDDVPPNRRDMAMVFQVAIFPHLNVFENIAWVEG